ncbi:unnamed protein product [Caenorhabditis auriculariae]|uniref:Serpentine receptor class gamma n=1 Tax=Caenorhabditis auriculariae TaxID=2777116 RepID=A0A8S1HQM8_9PELO|nr:unnamed protein product [Caenorhabditis auriculariae]
MMEDFRNDIWVFFYYKAYIILPLTQEFNIWFGQAQNISSILISIHRLTTALFFRSNQFWKRYVLPVYFASMMLCFIGISPLFYFGNFHAKYVMKDGLVLPYYDSRISDVLIVLVSFLSIFFFFFNMLLVIINFFTMSRLLQGVDEQSSDIMRRITRIALTQTLIHLGLLGFNVLNAFRVFTGVELIPFQLQVLVQAFVTDMAGMSMPYILIACDSNVRRFLTRQEEVHSIQLNVRSSQVLTS